jgi:hypothetical protein
VRQHKHLAHDRNIQGALLEAVAHTLSRRLAPKQRAVDPAPLGEAEGIALTGAANRVPHWSPAPEINLVAYVLELDEVKGA